MKVHPFTIADLPYIAHLQPEGWLPIISHFEFYTSSDFCFPIKCVFENRIVGIGTAILHETTGWLAHIIVDKDFRNQGIGTLITQSLMEQLRRSGIKTMLLIATPLGEPVYHKLGFEKETVYVSLRDGKTTYPEENSVLPFQQKYADEILKLDQFVSGESRQKLLTPHLINSFVTIENDVVTGCFMPTLGEGYVIALSTEAGKQLLQLKHSQVFNTSVPIENETAINFLLQHGFVEYRKVIRMWYGERISWQPDKLFGRIGGNLG